MERNLRRIESPEQLDPGWNTLATCYFQKREFLAHLHEYNPCEQRYYELYIDSALVAATIVYTLKINLFTFSGISSPVKMHVVGLPASVAAEPLIGDRNEFGYLLENILSREKGVIVGLNLMHDDAPGKVVAMRTLPTIVLRRNLDNKEKYESGLRHPYRRRYHRILQKFNTVVPVTTGCDAFTEEHYALYLQIMKRTRTRLETLSMDSFRYLPSNFRLTTYYDSDSMLCWNVVCEDHQALFFYFGGMNYALRDQYDAYYNNLMGILEHAFRKGYREIDLGQTAETAKLRLGGELSERRMFLYHRNPVVQGIFRLVRNLIEYKARPREHHVFKNTVQIQKKVKNESVVY